MPDKELLQAIIQGFDLDGALLSPDEMEQLEREGSLHFHINKRKNTDLLAKAIFSQLGEEGKFYSVSVRGRQVLVQDIIRTDSDDDQAKVA